MTTWIRWAQALKAADDVDTCASVMARIRFALVDVDAAHVAGETATLANGGWRSFLANAPVFARIGVAVTAIFAAFTTQFDRAFATEIIIEVMAFTRIQAWRRGTWVSINFAPWTNKTGSAMTLVRPTTLFAAGSTIQARLGTAYTYSFFKKCIIFGNRSLFEFKSIWTILI